jgi:hypothetical protein
LKHDIRAFLLLRKKIIALFGTIFLLSQTFVGMVSYFEGLLKFIQNI